MYIRRILVAIALLGAIAGFVFVYFVYNTVFMPNTAFENDQAYVYVKSDDNFNDVKEQLTPLLKNVETFTKVAERKGYINNIKAGKYSIKKEMNNNEIINSLRSKNIPVDISFNNQETIANLAGRIATQIEADSLDLLESFTDQTFLDSAKFDQETALAMYVPNSYEFFWNTSAEGFRDRMLKEYKRFWTETRLNKAKAIGLKPLEVVTLASIVHEETVKVDERPRVAGVYINRLKKKMALQADPTVIYALKKEANDFDKVIKRVLYKDLELDSPYNTYKYVGLPPGPIAMPDISAIDAVLNHEKHNFLYFVADIENFGYHKFAKTLSQHNANKQAYVRWLNSQKVMR
ncbi:endolytic transglycosylase MltG [Galbibacter sp. EGI 63066]|uniref:endolytic transglycosylase MltG n=1 Tax=Galbibacter sp. EGI 63066 TaxID=2993559 RepID=UPI00224936C7|nr:endolytic transglycosylase MltG [Galbibacter sp. EGI 63066]MCX2681344.1 endolytic transglycosylase MltG [Galbibacter sp. EGI 63066]